MRLPHLEVTGGLLGTRTLYAVHTSAPTNPRWTGLWAGELALIGEWTRARPAPVVAGDLNAVVDHRRLRAGRGLVATFPRRCRAGPGSASTTSWCPAGR